MAFKRKIRVCAKEVRDLGFRSKFEYLVNKQLMESDCNFDYEGSFNKIYFVEPEKVRYYLADFLLENGIIVEAKGYFDAKDRKKHLLIKSQWPELDIRILFMSSKTKLSKRSKTTYASWCDKNDIMYADMEIPNEWLIHKKSKTELNAIKNALKAMDKKAALINYGDM